jgi:hypothetical protein
MASAVRAGVKASSAAISLSIRPSTPPTSLTRLNAVSVPSFICRPSSFEGPENGAAIPNRISRSVTPRTGGRRRPARSVLWRKTMREQGPDPAGRSTARDQLVGGLQSICPDVTALRPSATVRSSNCVRSERSASLDEASVITAVNLSTMT